MKKLNFLKKMKYSFLLPTRRRATACINSIHSIYSNANNKDIFEIMLAFDEDDETRDCVIEHCRSHHIHHSVIVTQRYGYVQLHAYVNKLCEISNGSYVWYWSDDAFIETNHWDTILEKYTNEQPDVAFDFIMGWPFSFPLIPKKYTDVMKHFSLNTHIDTWMEMILKPFSLTVVIPEIKVFHNRHEGTGNSMQINYEEVNQSVLNTSPEFFSMFCTLLRQIDQNRIVRNFPHLNLPTTQLQHEKTRIGFVGMSQVDLSIALQIVDKHHLVLGYDTQYLQDEYKKTLTYQNTGVDHKNLKFTKDLELVIEFGEIIFMDCQELHVPFQNQIKQIIDICERLNIERNLIMISSTTIPIEIIKTMLPESFYISYYTMGTSLNNRLDCICFGGNPQKSAETMEEFYNSFFS